MAIRFTRVRATLVGAFALSVVAVAGVGVAPQQQPTFRAGVEIVAIDVNVVDGQARPVDGLKPADFTVTVDRKPRKIVSVQYINHGSRLVPGRGKGGGAEAAVLDALAAPIPPEAARNVLLLIDTDTMETTDGMNAVRAAKRFLDTLPASDRVGIATIPRLPSVLSFVADRTEARKALAQISTEPAIAPPSSEFTVGLQEAYDVDRHDNSTISEIVGRECKCVYPNSGDAPSVSARDARAAAADSSGSGLLSVCTSDKIVTCVQPLLMYAHQVALDGHMKAQRSLDALRAVADALREIPGPKTVVFISGGLGIPETSTSFDPLEPALANGQMTLYTLYIERMSLGQVARRVSPSYEWDDRIGSIGLENVTAAAGGVLVRVVGQVEAAFDRVVTEMSGSYLIGIEVEPGDRDGKPHAVDVKVSRKGVEVRSRRRYVIEPEKPGARRAEAAPPPVSDAARAARRAARAAPVVPEIEAITPEVMAMLVRAGEFSLDYQPRIDGLLSDERSDQTLSKWKSGAVMVSGVSQTREDWFVDKRRRIRSDYLLARGGGPPGWQQFRDPYEVDGATVRPRTGRLSKLFAETPATAIQEAAKITADSVRYNLGFGERNMDVPALALVLLEPGTRDRFFFRKEAEEDLNGVTVWRVAYTERATPTIFGGQQGAPLPLQGTMWIEPWQGRLVRSLLQLNMDEADAEIIVTYAPAAELGGLWVPIEVRQTYTSDTQKLESVARYTSFRMVRTGK